MTTMKIYYIPKGTKIYPTPPQSNEGWKESTRDVFYTDEDVIRAEHGYFVFKLPTEAKPYTELQIWEKHVIVRDEP